jgi:hypothetical protein
LDNNRYVKLDAEELEKIKFFVQATLKILKAYDEMLVDERIDKEIREEYQEKIL